MKPKQLLSAIATHTLILGLSMLPLALRAQPAFSAQKIRFNFVSINFSLSVDSLELYAKEGKIDKELQFYANFVDEQALLLLRQVLQKRIDVDPIILYRLSKSPMIEEVLRGLGEVVSTHLGYNGFYPLRGAILSAAMDREGEGLTLVNVLRKFPTQELWIDTDRLLQLQRELTGLNEYRLAATDAVIQAAATSTNTIQNKSELRDLSSPGSFGVVKRTLSLAGRRRQSPLGASSAEEFKVNLYLPQGLTQPAPVIILSHGFASNPRSFNYLGEHLASHGIVAAAPQHIGSDADYELQFLEGKRTRAVSAVEFIERPLDVKYLLDKLEELSQGDPSFQGILNMSQVGIIGHSFGGYTALAVGGARINHPRLRQQCGEENITLNMSLILQCRASGLPPFDYRLQDPRIKGVITISPITSTIFGPESLGKMQVPVMMFAGSEDVVAPVVEEQIHPFTWLNNTSKYLALMIPGDHFSNSDPSSPADGEATILESLTGVAPALGKPYIEALSVAFIKAHISGESAYLPYLSSSYAQSIPNTPLELYVIESLTPEQLESAYGNQPPQPIVPAAIVNP